jgi:uncharacterized membrane protein
LIIGSIPIYREARTENRLNFVLENDTLPEYPFNKIDIHGINYLQINLLLGETAFQEIDRIEFENIIIQIGDQSITLNEYDTIYIKNENNLVHLACDIKSLKMIKKVVEDENNKKAILFLKFTVIINGELFVNEITKVFNIEIKTDVFLRNVNPLFPTILNFIFWMLTGA